MKWKRWVTPFRILINGGENMGKIIDRKLFWVGMRRIKLAGVACAIICLSISGIIPLLAYITSENEQIIEALPINQLAAPLLPLFPFVLLFVLLMFGFLNDRKQSDFYHAIPQSRVCVYGSFMAAVLSWVIIIALSSLALEAICWGIMPGWSFAAGDLILIFVAFMLGSLMLAGLMATAMMLTGTLISNLAIGALLVCFTRVICLIVVFILEDIVPVFALPAANWSFVAPQAFLPLAVLIQMAGGIPKEMVYTSPALLTYTLIIGSFFIILAGWLYKKRRSEMAGQSAPSRGLQHIFRCAVTLPFALLCTALLLSSIYNDYFDWPPFIIMLLLTLIVYYMYELITSKNMGKMLRATPYLAIILVLSLVFGASMIAVRSHILDQDLTAENISSVTNFMGVNEVYQDIAFEMICCNGVEVNNADAVDLSAAALEKSVNNIRNSLTDYYSNYSDPCTIHLAYKNNNGKLFYRNVRLNQNDYDALLNSFMKSDEYLQAYLKLPEEDMINNIVFSPYVSLSMNDKNTKEIWNAFVKEYQSLTDAQKLQIKGFSEYHQGKSLSEPSFITAEINGQHMLTGFYNAYEILPFMKETISCIGDICNNTGATINNEEATISNMQQTIRLLKALDQDNGSSGIYGLYSDIELNCNAVYSDEYFDTAIYLSDYDDEEVYEEGQTNIKQLSSILLDIIQSDDKNKQQFDPDEPFILISIVCSCAEEDYDKDKALYDQYVGSYGSSLAAINVTSEEIVSLQSVGSYVETYE